MRQHWHAHAKFQPRAPVKVWPAPPGKLHHNSCTTRSPCPVPVWCLYHAPVTETQRELGTVLSQLQSWMNGFCSPSRGSSA
ncbi:HTH-type transcriptional regulator YodB, partial [Clarias magur]